MRRSLLALAVVACGHSAATEVGSAGDPGSGSAATAVARDASRLELAARPLGLDSLAGFRWRRGPGQGNFAAARKAENREDWATVATAAGAAYQADHGHLEAAWLYAVALAKTGKLDDVLAPLESAGVGDFGKWGIASLDQPAFQSWLATPTGEAWRRRVDEDRAAYAAALARAVVVLAQGDVFAFDPEHKRWHRLTRTYGGVIAAFAVPDARKLAYVTSSKKRGLAVGLVDLATGKSTRPQALAAPPPVQLAFVAQRPGGFWIGAGSSARALDDDGKLHVLGSKGRPPGAWLEVFAHTARAHRVPIANVSADWDQQSLASAMRIATSNRVVAAPATSPGALVVGDTVAWSRDRAHLAFVAQLDDHCAPGTPSAGTAAFVADAATGAVRELERATGGLAIEWVDDRQVAIAGDHGVSLVAIDGSAPAQILEGAEALVTPRRKPKCTPEPAEPEPVEPPDDEE